MADRVVGPQSAALEKWGPGIPAQCAGNVSDAPASLRTRGDESSLLS